MTSDTLPMGESITTERLLLRPPRVIDAAEILDAYATDEEVTRYLTWTPRSSVAEVEEFLAELVHRRESGGERAWVLIERASDSVVAMVSARRDRHAVELGYVLARSHWGRGLMTEAVEAIVGSVFEDRSVFRVWAVHDVENPASGRVMEKAGMQREGIRRRWALHPNVSPEPRDVVAYSVTR